MQAPRGNSSGKHCAALSQKRICGAVSAGYRPFCRNLELAMPNKDDKRARLTAICRAFPSAEVEDKGDHAIYRVRGKVFGYFLDNHHDDGIVAVCVKAQLGENEDRA